MKINYNSTYARTGSALLRGAKQRVVRALAPLCVTLFVLTGAPTQAQNAEVMSSYEQELQQLFSHVFYDATDNERYNANEQALATFYTALEQKKSFFWDWNLGKEVSVLTSSDRQFRIITWAVTRDNGERECFGFLQSYNEKEERYDIHTLMDRSDELINMEETVLSPDNWLGSVYQELIETKHEGKTYYTLLGWTGVDALTQRKVIEPLLFRGSNATPQFGQNLFRREKNRRRVVLQYTNTAMVNLRYDEQYVRTFSNKRVKNKKGRTINVREQHDDKMKMIIFDEIAPMVMGMEGLYQYYIPTGTEKAYVFTEGRWELQGYAFGQDPNERLNKEFAPLPKDQPAYRLRNAQEQ